MIRISFPDGAQRDYEKALEDASKPARAEVLVGKRFDRSDLYVVGRPELFELFPMLVNRAAAPTITFLVLVAIYLFFTTLFILE